jgi:Tfp pilus assembly protein PilX
VVLKPARPRADIFDVERAAYAGPPDRGDIVLGWLTRLTVVLALLGVVGFDVVALGVGRLTAEDRAQEAARAAVRTYSATAEVQRAYEAALAEADALEDSIDPTGFTVGPDGAVTLTLQHTSATLLLEKIGPVRDWATSRTTVTARPAA